MALPVGADTLLKFMNELSEEYYSAGWSIDLEYQLWYAINASAPFAGHKRLSLRPSHLVVLRELSLMTNGWGWFDDDAAPHVDGGSFIPMDEWLKKLAKRERRLSNDNA